MTVQQRLPVILFAIAFLLLLTPLIALVAASPNPGAETLRGRIVAVEGADLTLAVETGAVDFSVTGETAIQIDGEPGKFADLEAGQMAQVDSAPATAKRVALAIRAQRTLEPPLGEGKWGR
ncbi:hypothetical protein [Lignipirellula cremea]|uniref:DUF5666 domain-containing protein n=1 Tax=Lignipirellula cremea TaxID=2528010 RepID=A0A518DN64_9BACT|nr:hypothetical protein [Lignipirellula cremea]QDU93278.1 hypothetical protein Pla8534_10580 [Lignipirellula cremea]